MPSAFFGAIVTGDDEYVLEEFEGELMLSGATIGGNVKDGERVSLALEKDGQRHIICTLVKGKTETQKLEIAVDGLDADSVKFLLLPQKSKAEVHLVGILHLYDVNFDDVDEDEELEEEESAPTAAAPAKAETKAAPAKAAEAPKKETPKKAETAPAAVEGEKSKKQQKKEAAAEAPKKAEEKKSAEAPKKAEEKKREREEEKKTEEKAAKKQKTEEPKQPATRRTLAGGLVAEDIVVGQGKAATPGKSVSVHYRGKLNNEMGKEFDASRGEPFTFKLGLGEVIQGWDKGVEGMKEGGVRKLTIPSKMAYGNQKIPGIPPNSTLFFEVKLIKVK